MDLKSLFLPKLLCSQVGLFSSNMNDLYLGGSGSNPCEGKADENFHVCL
jgi:hypothetical protein